MIRNQFLCQRSVLEMKGLEVEVWAQVLESLPECLVAQWRDCYVPIIGECGELNSPSHPSQTAAQ